MDCRQEIQNEFLQQNNNEFVKEEYSDVQILTMPKIEVKTVETKEPKPFSARMTIRNIYYSSDSESDSGSDCETDVQNFTIPKIEAKIADTKAPKPFSARMTTRNVHYSSDSDSSYFSDSDSETIAEEESKLQKENSPKDTAKELEFQPNAAHEKEKTPAEPKEALDFDPNKRMLVQMAKSSITDSKCRPNVQASSILVKHGIKRAEEAGDKDSKRARTTQE